jgi:hypothetical protein
MPSGPPGCVVSVIGGSSVDDGFVDGGVRVEETSRVLEEEPGTVDDVEVPVEDDETVEDVVTVEDEVESVEDVEAVELVVSLDDVVDAVDEVVVALDEVVVALDDVVADEVVV